MKITAIIPARSGSKSIKNKNIIKLLGHPLIAYSIAICKISSLVNEIIVSTDSKKIAKIAKKYGANVPFIRPKNISKNNSIDVEFFLHYLNFLKKNNLKKPDIILHLRPTSPLRTLKIFNRGIKYFIKMKSYTSMRSVYKSNITPYKTFELKKNSLTGFFPKFKNEYYNLPRQKFPESYIPNGYIDIVKPSIIKKNKLHGKKILAYKTDIIPDIDSKEDFKHAENEVKKSQYKEIINYLKNTKKI